MNVNVIIETTDNEKHITHKSFSYDYESTKARFIEKMAKEVKEQMGHNVSSEEMEQMLKASHPKAVFEFAVCSDWLLEHINTIAADVKTDNSESYRVESFELLNSGVSELKYDGENAELRDMFTHMNRDFNEMIKEA